MLAILLRRLRDLVIVLFVVGTMMFFIIRLIPGDPASSLLGKDATPQQILEMRQSLGLEGSLGAQYLAWVKRVVVGDFGMSITLHQPVLELILKNALPTFILAVVSMAIAFFIAVGITTWSAVSPRNPLARMFSGSTSFAIAIPEFWIALVFVFVFGVTLGWLPTSGYVNPITDPAQGIPRYILPVASIVIGLSATYVLVLRESVLREMTRLYLRTARVKGLDETRVMTRHVLKNAMLPCITVMGTSFAHMIGGVVIIETIFVIPGLGSLLLGAINARDYALVQGITMFIALLFVLVNLVVDLLYVVLDPKVRVS